MDYAHKGGGQGYENGRQHTTDPNRQNDDRAKGARRQQAPDATPPRRSEEREPPGWRGGEGGRVGVPRPEAGARGWPRKSRRVEGVRGIPPRQARPRRARRSGGAGDSPASGAPVSGALVSGWGRGRAGARSPRAYARGKTSIQSGFPTYRGITRQWNPVAVLLYRYFHRGSLEHFI